MDSLPRSLRCIDARSEEKNSPPSKLGPLVSQTIHFLQSVKRMAPIKLSVAKDKGNFRLGITKIYI